MQKMFLKIWDIKNNSYLCARLIETVCSILFTIYWLLVLVLLIMWLV